MTPEERSALEMHAASDSSDPLESGIAALLAENDELRAALEQANGRDERQPTGE